MRTVVFSESNTIAEQLMPVFKELGLCRATSFLEHSDDAADLHDPSVIVVAAENARSSIAPLVEKLRAKYQTRAVIVVVFFYEAELREIDRVLAAGADDCLAAPIDQNALRLRLKIAMSRANERRAHDEADRQLQTSIERFELAIQGANEGLWDAQHTVGEPWNTPGGKLWYSRRFKELLGFEADEFPDVIESWMSRLHSDDRARVIQAIVDHHELHRPFDVEYRLQTKSGEYRWFSARGQAKRDDQGRVLRVAGSLRDIQQIKETEERLRQSEARWRSLVENAPALIILTTPEGIIQFVNADSAGARASIGKSVYEYVESPYHELVRNTFEAVRKTGEPQRYEVEAKSERGIAWYASRLGPVWHNDRLESIVLISLDVTRRKYAELAVKEEREHLRRLLDLQERERRIVAYEIHDGLTQFLTAGIMHIESFAAQIKMTPDAEREFDRGIGLLREALDEARRLISGLRPPVLDELGIVAALEYLVNESREEISDVEFVHHVDFERLAAPLEVALFRVTQEALTNIRKHSGAQKARVELRQHGRWVRLIVRDWGCGFDPAVTQEERYGIQGIRQRARLLGTAAVVESAPGKGTMVLVDFPLVPEPARQQPSEK